MFYANAKTKGSDMAGRARDASAAAAKAAGTAAQTAAQAAAQGVNSAAQTAAVGVNKGVRQGVYSARGWAAPMIHNAADYTTATLAPKVSAALHATAEQVNPEDTSRKKMIRSIITWSALGAAVLAALGAAGVLARKRYQTATSAETEADTTAGTPTPAADADAESATATTSTEAGVNGRVSTPGW